MPSCARLLAWASVGSFSSAVSFSREHAESAANPIRKVVNMLQAMQQKVTEEGEKEKELYEKFMCYCKTGGSDLSGSIAAAKNKLGELATDIEAAESKHAQVKAQLQQAQADRAAGEKAMQEATAIREKEAGVYAQFKSDYNANLAALAKAISSIEAGMAGGFLQTGAANVLRKLLSHSGEMNDDDHQALASFLEGGNNYAPQSGQITGILKTMHDEMSASLADATATENAAIQAYKELMRSRLKEKEALTASIETKSSRSGDLGVQIASMKNDAGDTGEALEADQKFLAELQKGCATKTAEWEARSKTRAEELVALADTIKILNDDDALELFKKTLPSASAGFVQVQVSNAALRASALAAIRKGMRKVSGPNRAGLDFISLALHGEKIGFEKVIGMIDEMVANLKKEQVDDDNKKAYCAQQFDSSDDQKKALERKIADLETASALAKENIATLTEEIAALTSGIAELDKSVAEATANRKAEHAEYNELIASNSAAKEVLGLAKNRLQKFYNPKLYKTTTPPPTTAPWAPSFAQISEHVQGKADPGPPPATWGAFAKKSEENGGVIQMLNLLLADLDKEIAEAEAEEKDGQADYETLMADSAEKRTADSKSLSQKQAAKADTEAALEQHGEDHASTSKELGATMRYIGSLHTECDWLLKYFDVRQQARSDEIDSLNNAKAVLSGADFSLVQMRRSPGFLQRA